MCGRESNGEAFTDRGAIISFDLREADQLTSIDPSVSVSVPIQHG